MPRRAIRSRRWGYWIIVVGGLVVAAGVLVSEQTFLGVWFLTQTNPCVWVGPHIRLGCSGLPYTDEELAILSGLGVLLSGVGFSLALVGIAVTLRRPLAASSGVTHRTFLTLLLGGLLVAVGVAVLASETWYTYLHPLSLDTLYSLDLSARIVEAVGFFVAFLGVANAIRR